MKQIHKDHLDSDWTTVVFKLADNKIQGGLVGTIDDTNQFIIAGNFSLSNWAELVSSNPILIGKHLNMFTCLLLLLFSGYSQLCQKAIDLAMYVHIINKYYVMSRSNLKYILLNLSEIYNNYNRTIKL